MRKFLPYQQYDVQAIEQWLNRQSMAGYRLVKMDGVFPTFKKYYDHLYYYRVCYSPGCKLKGHSHFWGDLYIFEAQAKEDLPNPSYVRDSIQAAEHQKKPFFALALLVALFAILESIISDFSTLSPAYILWGITAAAAEVVWLVSIFMNWNRGRKIAKETIDIINHPPTPTLNRVTLFSCLISIAAMVVVTLL